MRWSGTLKKSGDVYRGTLADDAIEKNLHQNIRVYPYCAYDCTTSTNNSNTTIYYVDYAMQEFNYDKKLSVVVVCTPVYDNCMVIAYTDPSGLVHIVRPFAHNPSLHQPGSGSGVNLGRHAINDNVCTMHRPFWMNHLWHQSRIFD